MRKRILSVLTCLVVGVFAVGLCACGNNGESGGSGEEVSEEAWQTAIVKALDGMENYTCKYSEERKIDRSVIDPSCSDAPVWPYEFDKATKTVEQTEKVDAASGVAHFTEKEEIVADGNSEDVSIFNREAYYKTVNGSDYSYVKISDEEWTVHRGRMATVERARYILSYFVTSEGENPFSEGKTVLDLYSSFVFKDGKYTAELYKYAFNHFITCKVSLEFKNGNLSKFYMELPCEDLYSSNPLGGRTVISLTFTDIGTTPVTLPQGASTAIDDYIAQQ